MNILVTSGPIATIGHNGAPELTPFELSRDEIEGLYLEATNWADGEPIKTDMQAGAVDKLIDDLRAAKDLANERRIEENKPFDDGKEKVQARYADLIADNKSKKGKAVLAIEVLKKVVEPYRKKLADEKAAIAAQAAADAAAKRKEAEDAFRASQVTDLAQRAAAEALLKEADKADKAANKAEKAATTGLGLRTSYRPEINDPVAFARYCWERHRPELLDCMMTLAKRDVAAGQHTLPGVTVHEERSAI